MIAVISDEISQDVESGIDSFINTPLKLNQINQVLLQNELVDFTDQNARDKFFVGILRQQPDDIYSISLGTETGEYYGARRNQDNQIEIMRNNAETGGSSWYYSVNEDDTAGELVLKAGQFDPRTRDWYKAARTSSSPVFSPIYKHFVLNDLTVSAACPVYDEQNQLAGVLGIHTNLARVSNMLEAVVKSKGAEAVVIEKGTADLIANTLQTESFRTLNDGSLERRTIDDLETESFAKVYDDFSKNGSQYHRISSDGKWLHVNITPYSQPGIDWLILTVIPERDYTAGIYRYMLATALIIIAFILLIILVYLKFTNTILRKLNKLIITAELFSSGDHSQRVSFKRNDEFGQLAGTFNTMADSLTELIDNLDEMVSQRTNELEIANRELRENKDRLRLILDSAAEAIYGVDTNGVCTFANTSCVKILGFDSTGDLIGQNMHSLIHYKYTDGRPMPSSECKMSIALSKGLGAHNDDEYFYRKDSSSFPVEYFSYPQFINDEMVGAVVTFMDITERRKSIDRIEYLSQHDSLTGLYNRSFFDAELSRFDKSRNLPISIITGDVNGLKMTNDVFGHAAGDQLLKTVAEEMKNICRSDEIIARTGGDEFAILLPSTSHEQSLKIMERIRKAVSGAKALALKGSISLGSGTKTRPEQNIFETLETAENWMYRDKTLNRKNTQSDMLDTLVSSLHDNYPDEKQHAQRVSQLCRDLAVTMNLTPDDVKKVSDAGYLHDIGKIVLDPEIFKRDHELSLQEQNELHQHPIVGYRILNSFEETADLAEIVLAHHEFWDGNGYPKKIRGGEIGVLARILALAQYYDVITNDYHFQALTHKKAMQKIRELSGKRFDPDVVEAFISMMEGSDENTYG
jgi:diguanylate cyclase (GGDEF)-like protein/PAS domain S-box-containing protein/putative nucleotidyltransferase with HDIG domain